MWMIQPALIAQVCLFILFVSSTLAGSMALIGEFWPSLPMPHAFAVSIQGALALLLGGILMMSLMLSVRWLQWLSGSVLCLIAIYHVTHNLLAGPGDSGMSILTGLPRLKYGNAVCVLMFGLVGVFGFESRYGRIYGRIVGALGSLVGLLVWAQYWGKTNVDSSQLLFGLTRFVSLFGIGYGILLLVLPKMRNSPQVLMGRRDAFVGALGVIGTFILLVIASWGTHLQRQHTVQLFLQSQEVMLTTQLQESVELVERLADRWSALDFVVPPELMETELRRYFNDLPALRALLVINNHGESLVLAGKLAQESAWLRDVLATPSLQQWMIHTQDNDLSFAWVVPDPEQPLSVILLVIPQNPVKGLFFVSYDLGLLFKPLLDVTQQAYNLRLETHPMSELKSTSIETLGQAVSERIVLQIPHGPAISLIATTRAVHLMSWQGALIPAILGFGLLVSFLLMMTSNLVTVQRKKSRALKVEEQRFRSLFYQSPEAVFEFSKEGHYLDLNSKAMAITGIKTSELGTLTYRDLVSPERMSSSDFRRFEQAFKGSVHGVPQTINVSFLSHDAEIHEYECAFVPIMVDEQVVGVYAVVNDVSERYRALENQRLLTRSLETSDSAVLVIDVRKPTKPAVYINSAFTTVTGYSRVEVFSHSFSSLTESMVNPEDVAQIDRIIARGEARSLTVKSQRRDGTSYWNQISLAPVKDEDGLVTHYTAIMKDVSEAREQERKLAYQATYDTLTGLPNRAYFESELAQSIEVCKRNDGQLAVLFIDLDEFKPINDALGHRVGDEVLISIAKSVSEVVGPTDTLARLGGDEFVLLLTTLTSVKQAEQIAQLVLERIGIMHQVADNELYVTASIGISYWHSPLQTPAKLLQQADIAMYKAKQQGRDTFVVYADDLEEKLSLRVMLRNDLQEAIKNHHLFLHYQPQVDRHGRVCGLEALVRWNHPIRGLIPPAQFIPIAEETGQIIHIGRWVMTQACRDARQLLDMGILKGRMAVNLSPLQFHRPGFVDSLKAILTQTGLPAHCLELELTESILMRNSEAAVALLKILRTMGVSTSIDDFGTGYSSFSYLKNLPVERVKIDRIFVENVTSSQKDAAVCQGIITMAGQMGIAVIAEGVETQLQYLQLKKFGCDVFQGFCFARPMPFADLTVLLQQDPPLGLSQDE